MTNLHLLQVHFMRSVKRVSERVNRRNEQGHQVFTTIGYAIPKAKSQEDVLTLFRVLCWEADLQSAAAILGSDVVSEYTHRHCPEDWKVLWHKLFELTPQVLELAFLPASDSRIDDGSPTAQNIHPRR